MTKKPVAVEVPRCAVCNIGTGKLTFLPNTLTAIGKVGVWAHKTCANQATAEWAQSHHRKGTDHAAATAVPERTMP